MPRKPVYSSRRMAEAHALILEGRTARKSLAMGLGIACTTLDEWLVTHADFAAAVQAAKTELVRQREAQKQQRGRKSAYRHSMDEEARLHAATGKTDTDIAEELGISITTLRNWRENHPSLHAAIQNGRDHWAVTTVEQSLIKRAQGYEYEEVSTEPAVGRDKDGGVYVQTDKPIVKTVKKHMPPDTKAAQFVLTNRSPERWKDRQQVEHSGTLAIEVPEHMRHMLSTIFQSGVE